MNKSIVSMLYSLLTGSFFRLNVIATNPTATTTVFSGFSGPAAINTSATLNTSAVAANTTVEVTTAIASAPGFPSLAVGQPVTVNKPTVTPGLTIANARVSAPGILAVQYANVTTTAINVPSEIYQIGITE